MAANTTAKFVAPPRPWPDGRSGRQVGVGSPEPEKKGTSDRAPGIQAVDGGDALADKLVGIVTGGGVHGQAVDIPGARRPESRGRVDGMAHAVEDAARISPDTPAPAGVPGNGSWTRQFDAGGGLKELNHGIIAVDLKHLAAAGAAVGSSIPQLVVGDPFHLVHDHQRAGDLLLWSYF